MIADNDGKFNNCFSYNCLEKQTTGIFFLQQSRAIHTLKKLRLHTLKEFK